MLRATLRSMRQRKLRLLLSALAVVLGVTFVASSLVLTNTLGRSFDTLFADAYGDVDILVQATPNVPAESWTADQSPGIVPADLVATVADVPGVASATGMVEVDGARVIGADGTTVSSFGPPRLGINWTGDNDLFQLRHGRGPLADHEIAIDAALATAAGLSVGDQVAVLTREPRQEFTLVGTFGFAGGRDSFGGVQFVAFTDDVAQQLMLGHTDAWTHIEVHAADGVTADELRHAITAAIGDDYQVRTGTEAVAEQTDAFQQGLSFFNYILLGFAGIALFVGAFLILNTFSIVVAQRSRELAITRAIGASRRQLLGSVLAEALLVGLVAAGVGVAAGIGVGALLARVAASFASLPLAPVAIPLAALVTALIVGVLVSLIAATLPALRATRIPPVAAMRETATPDRPLGTLGTCGAALLLLGATATITGLVNLDNDISTGLIFGGLLGAFVGVMLLTPLLVRPAVAALGRPFSWSLPGRLGRLNSARNPRRTATTAAALMLGVALVTGVNVVLQSVKTSFADFYDRTVQAQLVIGGEPTGTPPPSFDPAVLTQAATLPQVDAIAGLYHGDALINGQHAWTVTPSDLGQLSTIFGATATHGELATLAADEIALEATTAHQWDLTVGTPVTVQLAHGPPHTLTVTAIYEDNALPGHVMLPAHVVTDLASPQPFLGFVTVTDDTHVPHVRAALADLLLDSPEVSVTDRSVFINQQTSQLDTVLTMIQVLLGLAILIAVLGIINTLALSVIERTRELGLLRAIGLGRGATMRMITVEAVVISLFGAVLGVVVGVAIGATAARALQDQGITTVTLPWSDLATYLALAAIVGIIAAALPAIRAARTNVLHAIAHQ